MHFVCFWRITQALCWSNFSNILTLMGIFYALIIISVVGIRKKTFTQSFHSYSNCIVQTNYSKMLQLVQREHQSERERLVQHITIPHSVHMSVFATWLNEKISHHKSNKSEDSTFFGFCFLVAKVEKRKKRCFLEKFIT